MSLVRSTVKSWLAPPSGHIEQLLIGSWHAKVYAGTDPLTSREIRFRKTCKTERAPANSLSDLRNDLDRFLFLLGGSDGEQLFGP